MDPIFLKYTQEVHTIDSQGEDQVSQHKQHIIAKRSLAPAPSKLCNAKPREDYKCREPRPVKERAQPAGISIQAEKGTYVRIVGKKSNLVTW